MQVQLSAHSLAHSRSSVAVGSVTGTRVPGAPALPAVLKALLLYGV